MKTVFKRELVRIHLLNRIIIFVCWDHLKSQL